MRFSWENKRVGITRGAGFLERHGVSALFQLVEIIGRIY